MLKMEEWIVLFVFAELVALGVLIVASCWCCRRSLQRARDEEVAHDLPVTRVVEGAASRSKTTTTAATAQSSSSKSHANAAAGVHDTENRESHDEDLASGGIWGFIAGVSPRGPRRPTSSPAPATTTMTSTTRTTTTTTTSSSSHAARGGTVEVVNISVNVAADDDRDDDKLATEGRKSGTAA